MNQAQCLHERAKINDAIRRFFREQNFTEVETPLFVRSPDSEPTLDHFETICHTQEGQMTEGALITSPEYSMKKLLGLGMDRIFTITKVFRNREPLGGQHNPEFSLLEWYVQGADYQACMTQTEALVRFVAQDFFEDEEQVEALMGTTPFSRHKVETLFAPYLDKPLALATREDLQQACQVQGLATHHSDSLSDLFHRIWITCIEPSFGTSPTFVYDYPRYQAALAQMTPNGAYAERFELYIRGVELCNGFTELTDKEEQLKRFIAENRKRAELGKRVFPIDQAFLSLLPSIQNPTYGNALGVDRLHMVLTGRSAITDVIPFPVSL